MGDDANLTEADRGKAVVGPTGDVIGRVVHVRGTTRSSSTPTTGSRTGTAC